MIILQQRLIRHKAMKPGQLKHCTRDPVSTWQLDQAGDLAAPFEPKGSTRDQPSTERLHLALTDAGQAAAEQQQPGAVQQLTQNAARQAGCTHQLIILSN